jgi:hypothetical protein
MSYQGLYHDPVTGLVYNRNRMLHTKLGRFTSRDPLGYVLALPIRSQARLHDEPIPAMKPPLRTALTGRPGPTPPGPQAR